MIADFANDISLETARQAHSGTSFTPEKRVMLDQIVANFPNPLI